MDLLKYDAPLSSFCEKRGIDTVLFYGDATDFIVRLSTATLTGENRAVALITKDADYFSVAKNIKDALIAQGETPVCLCLDDRPSAAAVRALLGSVKGAKLVIAVCSDPSIVACSAFFAAVNGCKLAVVPTNANFGFCFFPEASVNVSGKILSKKKRADFVIIDDKLFSSFKKHTLYDGVTSAYSTADYEIENRVSALIGGFSQDDEALSLLEGGLCDADNFALSGDVKKLIMAQAKCYFAGGYLCADDVIGKLSSIYSRYPIDSSDGERRFFALTRLLRIYKLYLSNDFSFAFRVPDVFFGSERICSLAQLSIESVLCNVPENLYDLDTLIALRNKIRLDKNILPLCDKLLNSAAERETLSHKVYAGRKYTVELFSQKENSECFRLAPFLLTASPLLKIIWREGITEYI